MCRYKKRTRDKSASERLELCFDSETLAELTTNSCGSVLGMRRTAIEESGPAEEDAGFVQFNVVDSHAGGQRRQDGVADTDAAPARVRPVFGAEHPQRSGRGRGEDDDVVRRRQVEPQVSVGFEDARPDVDERADVPVGLVRARLTAAGDRGRFDRRLQEDDRSARLPVSRQ